jgi:hypothetical protein
MEVFCWAMASPSFEVQEPLQNLYASTQVQRRAPTHDSAMRYLWCLPCVHVRCWKAPIVETVGDLSLGPEIVVGEIAQDQAD